MIKRNRRYVTKRGVESFRIFNIILKEEGVFVDDPVDRGGATKYGISHRFLLDIHSRAPKTYRAIMKTSWRPTKETIKRLTIDEAWDFFNRCFYENVATKDKFSYALTVELCDLAFNAGPEQSVRILQRALNHVLEGSKEDELEEDGVWGPKSSAAYHRFMNVWGGSESLLLSEYREARVRFYKRIVRRDPTQKRFLNGWISRARRLKH